MAPVFANPRGASGNCRCRNHGSYISLARVFSKCLLRQHMARSWSRSSQHDCLFPEVLRPWGLPLSANTPSSRATMTITIITRARWRRGTSRSARSCSGNAWFLVQPSTKFSSAARQIAEEGAIFFEWTQTCQIQEEGSRRKTPCCPSGGSPSSRFR